MEIKGEINSLEIFKIINERFSFYFKDKERIDKYSKFFASAKEIIDYDFKVKYWYKSLPRKKRNEIEAPPEFKGLNKKVVEEFKYEYRELLTSVLIDVYGEYLNTPIKINIKE